MIAAEKIIYMLLSSQHDGFTKTSCHVDSTICIGPFVEQKICNQIHTLLTQSHTGGSTADAEVMVQWQADFVQTCMLTLRI
eukprot:scaffold177638_cov48-Prasinocladus_malaysianus.AAC.1